MGKIARPPEVGSVIKASRIKHHISLSELSERSGVSKGMLSQIENGIVNPTIATAWKISSALGFSLHELFDDEKRGEAVEVILRDEAFVFSEDKDSWKVYVLSPPHMAEVLELYWVELKAGAAMESNPHAKGTVEFTTVIKGKVEVMSGEITRTIGRGDTARYQADVPHIIRNTTRRDAELYLVVRFEQNRRG